MRKQVPAKLEIARLAEMSDPGKFDGAFQLMGPCGAMVRIVASDASHESAQGWEHVSVSCPNRCPNWLEMCFVKDLFWNDDELVIQYHVPKAQHINNHPHVLHMWRDTLHPHPRMPPSHFVGMQGIDQDEARRLGRAGFFGVINNH